MRSCDVDLVGFQKKSFWEIFHCSFKNLNFHSITSTHTYNKKKTQNTKNQKTKQVKTKQNKITK